MKLSISQPMYMPWYGMFEQINNSDTFIHYDNVQLPTGAYFTTRVQVNTANGICWITIPINRQKGRHILINEAEILDSNWRQKHLNTLYHAYAKTTFFEQLYELAEKIILYNTNNLALFNQHGIEVIADYLGIKKSFSVSSKINCTGEKNMRLIQLCKLNNSNTYITGHGAFNYLDHELFDKNGITVVYPNYKCKNFTHINGTFTPYVTILDFIAHCGKNTTDLFNSELIKWTDFKNIYNK